MSPELVLSPAGHLYVHPTGADARHDLDTWTRRVTEALTRNPASGLFVLAAHPPDTPPSPSFRFWRQWACLYLAALCHIPETTDLAAARVEPPPVPETMGFLREAPPMPGGEYLTVEVVHTLWRELDAGVHMEVMASGLSLAAFLERRAPLWHPVGRVSFHLAENKRNPRLPFAFLATYAPHLSKAGRVQHQPLSQALTEYAGARNKMALIRLLAPLHRGAKRARCSGIWSTPGTSSTPWRGLRPRPTVF